MQSSNFSCEIPIRTVILYKSGQKEEKDLQKNDFSEEIKDLEKGEGESSPFGGH
jgi:hypothetical protein